MQAEQETYASIAQLAAELETIAAHAQHPRFIDLLRRSGLTVAQHQAVIDSTAFGPLTVALRRAEAYHWDLERLVPRVVTQHRLDDAEDVAAVLKHRLDKTATMSPRGKRGLRPRLVAGLIPEPFGAMNEEDRMAIAERGRLIEQRALRLAERAVAEHEPWTRRLGACPVAPPDAVRWQDAVVTLAAYRDWYRIASGLPVGRTVTSDAQRADRHLALRALREAIVLGAAGRSRCQRNDRRTGAVSEECLSGF
jgi:hypothetical protein